MSTTKIKEAVLRLLSVICFFIALIFIIQLLNPSPNWMDICTAKGCDISQQKILSSADIQYRTKIPQIFIDLSIIFFVLSILLSLLYKNINFLYYFSIFAIFNLLYGILYGIFPFFSYFLFSYGQSVSRFYSSLFIISFLFIGLYLNKISSKSINTSKSINSNFTLK